MIRDLAAALGDQTDGIDVNPVISGPDGCLAVDALIAGQSPTNNPNQALP